MSVVVNADLYSAIRLRQEREALATLQLRLVIVGNSNCAGRLKMQGWKMTDLKMTYFKTD